MIREGLLMIIGIPVLVAGTAHYLRDHVGSGGRTTRAKLDNLRLYVIQRLKSAEQTRHSACW